MEQPISEDMITAVNNHRAAIISAVYQSFWRPLTHIQLFAYDCLLCHTIANISDATRLQADLDQLIA